MHISQQPNLLLPLFFKIYFQNINKLGRYASGFLPCILRCRSGVDKQENTTCIPVLIISTDVIIVAAAATIVVC